MPESGVYVIVVGHNLEAKCDVANALASQENLFRPFACKRKKVIKCRRTVIGNNLFIVGSPDLSTPSWKHLEKDIEKFKTKVFLYVQDNDCIDSDDVGSLDYLQTRFSDKTKNTSFLLLRYNTKSKTNESFSSDESLSEDFPQLSNENPVILINREDAFKVKIERGKEIMKLFMKSLRGEKPAFEGRMSVDNVKGRTAMNISFNRQGTETDIPAILASVTATTASPEEEEFKSVTLPDLNNDDWILFRKTLKFGRARSNHVRVNVVGNQGAGKTTLVKRLQEIDIKCPDNCQPPTEGLVINQVTSRCVERNGVKYWETKDTGYEKELNLQRMAFALQHAEICTQNTDKQEDFTELELGSDFVENENDMVTTLEYGGQIDLKQKELYLQQVKRWRENSTEERMYVSYWDFAGQVTYYSTHQAFMAPSAVYVLVIDLSLDLSEKLQENITFRTGILKHYTVEETLKFWISSIKAYTRDEENGHAPFIIVGTHKDKVTENEIREKFSRLRQVLKTLTQVEFVAINNTLSATSDTHLQTLRNKILNLGLGVIDEEIPAQWINLENMVLQKKDAGESLVSFESIQELDAKSDVPMKDKNRIEAFLEHEHRRGWLMHFCQVAVKDIIILEPSFLANFFNILLRNRPNRQISSSGVNKNGIMHEKFILEAASYSFNIPRDGELLQKIASILTHIHIIHKYEEGTFFVPCLLPYREDREGLKNSRHHEKALTLKLSFADAFVPPAFFHLLTAALLEEDNLTIYKKNDEPRLYNLFVCFCFERETLWLEVYWHDCCIFFELKNYSQMKKICEPECNKMIEVMEIIQDKTEHILNVYRQDNVQCKFEIECPLHPSTFVDLQKAKYEGEVMCSDRTDVHSVSWQEISKVFPWNPYKCDDRLENNQSRPKDKDLGRLAKWLTKENATSLASKLKLPQGNILADQAISNWMNFPDMQRLKLLRTWKERNPEYTLPFLLKLLTKRKDYDIVALSDWLYKQVPYTEKFGINETTLDSIPDGHTDLVIASDCIGTDYTFLMLELGLTIQDIEIKRNESPNDMRDTIFKLFKTWRQTSEKQSTPRILLNTAKFLGINTAEIVQKLKEKLCP